MGKKPEKILDKLNVLNETVTEENLKNASKEDVFKYLRLVDELKTMLIATVENEEK